MKRMKQTIAILLSVLILFATMPMTAFAADESGEYEDAEIVESGECGLYVEWKLNSLGTLFLERNGPNGVTYDYPIEKNSPFRNDSRIKKIVVMEGVTYLGRMLFRDLSNLTEVVFEEGLQEMEFGVFSGCSSLTELELPASFNKFTTVAPFYESGIKKLTFKGNNLNTNTESGYAWDRFLSNVDIYVPLPFTLNGDVLNTYEEAAQALGHNGNKVYCVNDNATVKWKNYDGTVLEVDENAAQGVIPTYDSETPSRPSDDTNAYYFTGWSPEPIEVVGDMVYTATYGSYGKVPYIDENGDEQEVFARPLTGTETELPGGWYIAEGNITYSNNLKITGDVHLILADGATLSMAEDCVITGNTDPDDGENISIYCQREKTGTVEAATIIGDTTNIYGGNITSNVAGLYGMNIYGGNVDSAMLSCLKGYVRILGGNVNVSNVILAYRVAFGYTNATDSIYVNGFSSWGSSEEKVTTVTINDGCTLLNNDNGSEIETFSGTVSFEDIQKKTLVPYVKNPITFVSGENGTVESTGSMPASAYVRENVSFTVQPDQYYTLDTLTVKDALGNDIEVTISESHPSTNVTLKYYHFEMPVTPVTVTATFKSTAHEVSYLDENSNEKTVTAYSLDDKYNSYAGGWYVADKELYYSEDVTFSGDAHIILADSATVTVGNNNFFKTETESDSVNVYCQSGKTGTLNASIVAGTVNIYGGNINSNSLGGTKQISVYDGKINSNYMLVLGGNAAVYGGNINVVYTLGARNITLGYTHSDDSISAKTFNSSNPVTILDGQTLTDGSGTYTNTVTASDLNNKTLRPYNAKIINYAASQNGTVSGSKAASVGNEVTPVVTPALGYELDNLTVKDASENNVPVTDGKFTMPNSDVTVTATFKQIKYTVKWVVEGTVVETDENLTYGTMPEYNGATPSKQQDRYYTYSFAGWSPEITAVTDNVTYTAQFTKNAISFKIFVKKNTGEITLDSVTGETTVAGVKEMLAAETGIPAAEQRLIFAGKELADDKTLAEYSVEKETTIRLFTKAYTITWKNGDEVLATDTVSYGDTPAYSGETPTKADDENYTYTFAGWSPEVTAVSGDATYTAQYTATPKAKPDGFNLTVEDKIFMNLYINVDDYTDPANATVTVTYNDPEKQTPTLKVDTYSGEALAALKDADDGRYVIPVLAAPAQIRDEVTVTVTDRTEPITASVAEYCETIIAQSEDDELVNLAKAMLDYGKACSDEFDYNESAFANQNYYDTEDVTTYLNSYSEFDSSNANKQFAGYTYIAKSVPALRIYLNTTEAEVVANDLKATVNGNVVDINVVEGTDRVCVDITGILAEDLINIVTIEFNGGTLKLNPLQYAKVKGTTTDFSRSLYNYWFYAKTYFK